MQQNPKKLSDAKATAVSEINGLKFLSDKHSFTDRVNEAGSINAVASILSEAKAQDAANELRTAKDTALATAKGYTHVSDKIKTTATTAIEAEKSKAEVDRLIDQLKVDENNAKKLSDTKATAVSKINSMTFLQAVQKDNFVKQANSAKDITALKKVIDAARNKNYSESQKGTVTFVVLGNLGRKTIKTVSKRIEPGKYSITLKELDVPGLTKYTQIDGVFNQLTRNYFPGTTALTGTIKAQEGKIFSILTDL